MLSPYPLMKIQTVTLQVTNLVMQNQPENLDANLPKELMYHIDVVGEFNINGIVFENCSLGNSAIRKPATIFVIRRLSNDQQPGRVSGIKITNSTFSCLQFLALVEVELIT